MELIIQNIVKSIKESRTTTPVNKEIFSDKEVTGKNEFLFFIKPEITLDDNKIRLNDILNFNIKRYYFTKNQL